MGVMAWVPNVKMRDTNFTNCHDPGCCMSKSGEQRCLRAHPFATEAYCVDYRCQQKRGFTADYTDGADGKPSQFTIAKVTSRIATLHAVF